MKCLGEKANGKIKAMSSLKQVLQIGRNSSNEESQSHNNSKIAQVIFLQKKSTRDILEAQEQVQEEARQRHVEASREILKRVIDKVTFLGKQELTFRSH